MPSLSPSSSLLLHARVVLERAGRGELTQLVADHRLGDVHRDVLAAVVHGDGVAHHLRDDRGAAAPGLDDILLALLVEDVHLLAKVVFYEGALLQDSPEERREG